ncbi:hypothetical protein JOM56_002972 [Amanita muscaria]
MEDDDAEDDEDSPRLDNYLSDIAEKFTSLQTFSLPTLYNYLPMVPQKPRFLTYTPPSIISVVALLHSVEILWFKHIAREHFSSVPDDLATPSELVKGNRTGVRTPVALSRLTSLAVTAPGCGLDIILSINAPELRNLHIDGSRGSVRGSDKRNVSSGLAMILRTF